MTAPMNLSGCMRARRLVVHDEHEYSLAGVTTKCPGFRQGDDVTADGLVYRRLPDVYPNRAERAFDRRVLADFMETVPDNVDTPSAVWGACQILLLRRMAARAEGLAHRADDDALPGAGQDPPSLPV